MEGKETDSKYRHILFQGFMQRRSEKLGGRWRGRGVTGDFFFLSHILRDVHMGMGVRV